MNDIDKIKLLLQENIDFFANGNVVEIALHGMDKIAKTLIEIVNVYQDMYVLWYNAKEKAINENDLELLEIVNINEVLLVKMYNIWITIINKVNEAFSFNFPDLIALAIENQFGVSAPWMEKNNNINAIGAIPIVLAIAGVVCATYLLGYIISLIAEFIATAELNKNKMIAAIYKIDPGIVEKTKVKNFEIDIIEKPIEAIGKGIEKAGSYLPIVIGLVGLYIFIKR